MDIVNAMKMNPFQASLTPLDFMRWMLASIGQEKFDLPDDEGKASLLFLQRLTTLGYATFELDTDEVDLEHPIPSMQGNLKKQVKSQKQIYNMCLIINELRLDITTTHGIVCHTNGAWGFGRKPESFL